MTDQDDAAGTTPPDEVTLRRTAVRLTSALPPMEFSAGFTDRTMARIAASRDATPPGVLRFTAMQRSFRVLAAAAAVAIVALGLHNTIIARTEHSTLVEAAIGLQPVLAENVLSYTSEVLQ